MRQAAAADKSRLHRVYRIKVDATGAVQRADGSWEFDGVATRGDAVFDYSADNGTEWKEYRPLDEVFSVNSIASLEGAALTDDHPLDFVDIYNARELVRGHVMKAWQDGALMRVRVLVRDAELIQKIRDGKVELSCGYSAVVIPGDGVHPVEGAYQAKQTQIVHNHLAVVDAARAGPVARLAVPPMPPPAGPGAGAGTDSKRPDAGKGKRDNMNEIVINGVKFAVDPAATSVPGPVAEAYNALMTQLQQQAAKITELEAKSASGSEPAPIDPNAAANAAAAAAADKAKQGDSKDTMDKAAIQKAIDDGVKLAMQKHGDSAMQRQRIIGDAAPFLPANYDPAGKSDAQIAADALTAHDKDYKPVADKMVADNDIAGLAAVLRVRAIDHGKKFTRDTAALLGRSADGTAIKGHGADDERQAMVDRRSGRKQPAAAAAEGK